MSAVLDNLLVGLLLFASVSYALVTLSPRNLRRRMLGYLATWLARAPRGLRLSAAAQRIARSADDKAKGACGGCDNCGSEPGPQQSGAEIRVPLADIARRPRH